MTKKFFVFKHSVFFPEHDNRYILLKAVVFLNFYYYILTKFSIKMKTIKQHFKKNRTLNLNFNNLCSYI